MSKKMRIIIVDDDSRLRKTLLDILRAKGYAPITAATGQEALDGVEQETPTVALIDLKLEDMSGLEVMKRIKKRSPDMECIVLTGYASQASAIEAINLGAYSYVQKPYDMEQLLVTIRRATEKREAAEALRESEERFSLFMEYFPACVFIKDQEARTLFVNRYMNDIFGAKEWLGKTVFELFPSDVAEKMMVDDRITLDSGYRSLVEEVLDKNGVIHVYETHKFRLDRQNKPPLLGGIALDITERRKVESELQERMKELETYYRTTLGREGRVIELKQEVNELLERLGENKKYRDCS